MKGSPLIATAITIIVLLGLYLGMRAIILPESTPSEPAAHGDHSGHDHGDHSGHDDTALESQIELYFSSKPASVRITQPSTDKVILELGELDDTEWDGPAVINLTGHHLELQVEVSWQEPGEMNFVEINISPARHATKKTSLRSDGDISDIAELVW